MGSRRRHTIAALLVTLVGCLLLLGERRAGAVELADGDFRVRFGEDGGEVCVLVPASLRDANACAGVDRSTLGVRATAKEEDIVALALLRQNGWGVVLAVVRDPVSTGLLDRRGASEWLWGLREGVRHGLAPDARFTLTEPPSLTNVNGLEVFGTEMTVEPPSGEASRAFLGFAAIDGVTTRRGAYVLTFAATLDHAVETRRIAATTLLTLHAGPARVGEAAYRLARVVAEVAGGVVVVPAALSGLVLFVHSGLRRRRARRLVAAAYRLASSSSTRAPGQGSAFRVPPSLFTQRLRLSPELALDDRCVPFRALVEQSRALYANPRHDAAARPK
jgi:hypothetical protein